MNKSPYLLLGIIFIVVIGAYFIIANNGPKDSSDIRDEVVSPPVIEEDMTADWIATTTSGVSFKYPKDLGTLFQKAVAWPPQLTIHEEPFSCAPAGDVTGTPGRNETRVIGDTSYCVIEIREGAAGSVYTDYSYTFIVGDKTAELSFSTRMPNCSNYVDGELSACEDEEAEFDIDTLVDRIAETITQ